MGSDQSIRIMEKALGDAYSFIHNDAVTNIEVNGRDGTVFIDGIGGRKDSGIKLNESKRAQFLGAAASYAERTIDKQRPTLAMALPDELGNCRLEASVWPITNGPSMAIRKPSTKIFPISDYAQEDQVSLIKDAISTRKNMLIAGSTDSGKTSLLKSILQLYKEVCPNERMITIEDTEELVPVLVNTESLFTAPDKQTLAGDIMDMKFLLKKSLRKNPDRIIVGEVRDDAALTVLNSWDSGHNGGICTFHAGSASDGFWRFFRLAGLNEDKTSDLRFSASNVDYIFWVNKNEDGQRRIEEIAEVSFDDDKKDVVFNITTF